MSRIVFLAVTLVFGLTLLGCSDSDDNATESPDNASDVADPTTPDNNDQPDVADPTMPGDDTPDAVDDLSASTEQAVAGAAASMLLFSKDLVEINNVLLSLAGTDFSTLAATRQTALAIPLNSVCANAQDGGKFTAEFGNTLTLEQGSYFAFTYENCADDEGSMMNGSFAITVVSVAGAFESLLALPAWEDQIVVESDFDHFTIADLEETAGVDGVWQITMRVQGNQTAAQLSTTEPLTFTFVDHAAQEAGTVAVKQYSVVVIADDETGLFEIDGDAVADIAFSVEGSQVFSGTVTIGVDPDLTNTADTNCEYPTSGVVTVDGLLGNKYSFDANTGACETVLVTVNDAVTKTVDWDDL